MARSPFLRSVCFWFSFAFFCKYSGRDRQTGRQNYPSYAIFKEKIIKDTWRDGFNGDKLQTDFGHYWRALNGEFKGLFQ